MVSLPLGLLSPTLPTDACRPWPSPSWGSGGQPLRWSDDPIPWHLCSCVIPTPCARLGLVICFKPIEYRGTDRMLLPVRLQKVCGFHGGVLQRSLSLRSLILRKASCHVVSLFKEKPTWRGNEVSADSQKGPRPASCPVSELRASSSHPGDDHGPSQHSDCSLVKDPKPEPLI